jgi:hypothetical protein
MKNCANCDHIEIKAGILCPRCMTEQDTFIIAASLVPPDGISGFAETLRTKNVESLLQRRDAWVLQKVLGMLRRLCRARGVDEDQARSALATRLVRQAGLHERIDAAERIKGEGSYLRNFANEIKSAMDSISDKTTKQAAEMVREEGIYL